MVRCVRRILLLYLDSFVKCQVIGLCECRNEFVKCNRLRMVKKENPCIQPSVGVMVEINGEASEMTLMDQVYSHWLLFTRPGQLALQTSHSCRSVILLPGLSLNSLFSHPLCYLSTPCIPVLFHFFSMHIEFFLTISHIIKNATHQKMT